MNIEKIVIHCSDSPHGRGDNAEAIHRWHQERGFDGIGYHYVITEDGGIERGRPEYWTGAHVRGHNQGSLGICLIGEEWFTNDQIAALVSLRDELQDRYPDALWFNHYELDESKTCPNFDAVSVLGINDL